MDKPRRPKLDEAKGKTKVSRLQGLGSRGDAGGKFDWGEALPEFVAAVVMGATRAGGLASFGKTRDGGAGTVTIFLDDERTTVYVKPGGDVDAQLEEIIVFLDALRD